MFLDKSNSDIISELLSVRGVGLWTAQIYLMLSLRRSDVFASGDLALKEGTRALFNMNKRPSDKELDYLSQGWRPFRTIAALIIWNFYGYIKNRRV
ncbi:MAG: hypothetical protein P8M50_03825 [Paracoccaceae bacterium]|nr:hypothetical protein [Paracoccaceae bacterium]